MRTIIVERLNSVSEFHSAGCSCASVLLLARDVDQKLLAKASVSHCLMWFVKCSQTKLECHCWLSSILEALRV